MARVAFHAGFFSASRDHALMKENHFLVNTSAAFHFSPGGSFS